MGKGVSVVSLYVLAAVVGLVMGSFLNVVIYRLPRGESLWSTGSHCPNCSNPILWYDNIPLVSFFLLGGRCRNCKRPISWRYPLVEALCCSFFLLIFWQNQPVFLTFSSLINVLRSCFFVCLLIPIFFIDLEHQIIPDSLSATLLISGIFFALVERHFVLSVMGIAIGTGLFLLIFYASILFLRQPGMGAGDVKLAVAIGAFLGWRMALVSFFLSFFVGALVAGIFIAFRYKGMKDKIPFGPFLATGAMLSFFLGGTILELYFNLFW